MERNENEQADSPVDRALWLGLLAWLGAVPLLVLLRGVRWDEAWEHSAVIAGLVLYPHGHPLTQALFNQYTFQNYPAALLQLLGAGPAVINGMRNVLSLYAVVLPVYLVTGGIGRRALLGHGAALLALQGVYQAFDSVYPLATWPLFTSYGHIGMGWVLTALGVLIWRRSVSGGAMAGLTPMIHIGQFPPLLLTLGALGPLAFIQRRWRDVLRVAAGLGMAALVCGAFWVWQQAAIATPPPTDGPYAVEGNAERIYQNYTAVMDHHRALPGVNSHLIAIAALVLGILAWRVARGETRRRAAIVALYIAACAGLAYGSLAIHLLLGDQTPFLVLVWMPYRVMNHAAPLALALAVVLVGTLGGRGGAILLAGATVAAAARVFAAPWLPDELYASYLADGEVVLYGLMGAAAALALAHIRGVRAAVAILAPALALVAIWHQFGAVALAAGSVYGLLAHRFAHHQPARSAGDGPGFSRLGTRSVVGLVTAFAAAAGLTAIDQYRHRDHLPRTAFERNVERVVREGGPPGAKLLADPGNLYVQSVYGIPVLLSQTSLSRISYMPRLGPVVNAMHADIYGIRLDYEPGPNSDGGPSPHRIFSGVYTWRETWTNRSAKEWRALAEKYGFHYIIAPQDSPLQLDELLHADELQLYRVADGRTGTRKEPAQAPED